MIVLDTHALLWWALDPERLSPRASDVVARMEQEGGFASSISIWELAVKCRNRKLSLPLSVDDLAARIVRGGVVELLPVDAAIWLKGAALDWEHRDPADRVIVATALLKGVPVLTKDDAIVAYPDVSTVW